MLPQPERVGGRRRYASGTVRRLAVIDAAQRAGLSLQEIIELIGASLGDPAAAARLREVAERKLPELEALIERAEIVKRWLQAAEACRCSNLEDCPLFSDAWPVE